MKRLLIIVAAVVALSGCAGPGETPRPTTGNGEWTTVRTPDGRLCDLYTWSQDNGGYQGYGFAGMDCEDREER